MIRRNKIITCLTATALTLSLISIVPQAATMSVYSNAFNNSQEDESSCIHCKKSTDENGITWKYHVRDDGNATLMGTFEPQENMVVPSELDGHKVDKIVELVEEVGRRQPDYGARLAIPKSVIIPEGVTYIGFSALSCKNLNDVKLPSSIKVMSAYSMNESWNDAHRDENGFVVYNGILVDGRNASGDVVIPDNITCIGDNAFDHNTNIESVSIPSSVKRIGKHSFSNCDNLNKVKIEDGLEVIGEEAFYEDYKLESVKVPSSIKEIGERAFIGNLTSSKIEDKTESGSSDGLIIGDGVLLSAKDAKGDVVIPSTVTKIQSQAFYNNQNIKSVKIPDSVTEIGDIAFAGSSITSVNIPGSVKNIPHTAFEMCTKLESVEIGEGVETISGIAFSMCKSLKAINIPSSVTKIEGSAFRGCGKLEKLTFGEKSGIKTIEDQTFTGCSSLKEVNLPSSVTRIGSQAFRACKSLETFNYGENIIIADDAFLDSNFNGDTKSRGPINDNIPENMKITTNGELFNARDVEGDVVIPPAVNKIGHGAFYNNKKIKSVTIPDSVTEIDYEAFEGSSITSVNISGSVKSIGKSAFQDCENLEKVEIGEGLEKISFGAFSKCTSLKEINIPSSVTRIEGEAFNECESLETLNYGENIEVAYNAFSGTKFNNIVISGGTVTENKDDDICIMLPEFKIGWNQGSNGEWFYSENGTSKSTGWIYDDSYSSYFYLDSDGTMVTGWHYDPNYGAWYYLNPNGTMHTGWLYDYNYGSWFYLNADGSMKTGWFKDNDGKWYYLYGNGIMAHNTWIGKYYVNSSGAWV